MNAGRSPSWISRNHLKNQGSNFLAYRLATSPRLGSGKPFPIQPKTGTMPADNGSGCHLDERFLPASPALSQYDPEQLVCRSESPARALGVKSEQLLTQGKIFEDDILAGPECTNNPAEEVPEPYDHAQNLTGTLSIELGAKSLILRVYDVLMNHRGGNCHVEGKVLSLFESHTEVIRKGKAHKPNEFGRLVRLDEVENGIVSGYQVLAGNPDDTTAWMPALQQHQACFGRAPEMATGDRGFFSAQNEREAQALGVKKVALPARGRLSTKRAQQQKQRWFRRALRWRAGCEATISTLKHSFSMRRATYKGEPGFQRYVGWCVITKNLFSIARYQARRRSHGQVG